MVTEVVGLERAPGARGGQLAVGAQPRQCPVQEQEVLGDCHEGPQTLG